MAEKEKGSVCVTGGTGYLASWLIMRLLQHGYTVHATIRSDPEKKKDISFLTNLPNASERLQVFKADLDKPDSFGAAIEGCIGVFHVAHPIDFYDKEAEETKIKTSVGGTLGILQACLDSKTVKRVVYTSSAATVAFSGKELEVVDESVWSDVDFIRAVRDVGVSYYICKTLTERAALEFAEKHGLDLVTVIPTFIHGPFICPQCPPSVYVSLAMIFGDQEKYKLLLNTELVHVDDVATAHIFLLEHPKATGRYICSAFEMTFKEMFEFLSARYPEYQISMDNNCFKEMRGDKHYTLSSKKLLDTGFKYTYGLDEMFDEAIQCCKEKGIL